MTDIIVLEADDMELRNKIGKRLADTLKIKCYGRELIPLAVQRTGIDEKIANHFDEMTQKSQPLFSMNTHYVFLPSKGQLPEKSEEYIFSCVTKVITEVIQQESCIILGHAASYTLRYMPNVFRVRLLTENNKVNKVYERYYNYYTGTYWRTQNNSDMVFNVRNLSEEEIVKKLISFRQIINQS